MSDEVLYIRDDAGIVTIRLNRPAARNALNTALAEGLVAACHRAVAEEARLVLLRGEGPVFCAGADLKERQGMTEDQVRARRLKGFLAYDALERLPMPSIAVVTGPAIGSGAEMVACCDFAIATPAARFSTPESLRGTVGATQRLPRIIGKRLAKDMMFTGRALSAEEALQAGLVTRIVAPEALEETLATIAATIGKAPPAALRLAKRCIDEGVERDPRGALATELMAIEENLALGEWRRTMTIGG
jgi:enoyl-CoA hydratase